MAFFLKLSFYPAYAEFDSKNQSNNKSSGSNNQGPCERKAHIYLLSVVKLQYTQVAKAKKAAMLFLKGLIL